jgi:hypothetical protein
LNRRLDEGEEGGSLLRWLNGTDTVKKVLADVPGVWNGRVNKQNLSHWRQTGYRDWKRQMERRDIALLLVERGRELGEEMDGVDLANHLSAVLVADYAEAIQNVQAEDLKPRERCAQLRDCLLAVAKVRREDFRARKIAMEWTDYLKEKREERIHENGVNKYGGVVGYYKTMKAQEQILREMEAEKLKEGPIVLGKWDDLETQGDEVVRKKKCRKRGKSGTRRARPSEVAGKDQCGKHDESGTCVTHPSEVKGDAKKEGENGLPQGAEN